MVIVITGVAGVGKTTVGRLLAQDLGWAFHDADDLHPPDNIERMRSGAPLADVHRAPWLAALARLIGEHVRAGIPMVLASSALRRAHRRALLDDVADPRSVRFVYLRADRALLAARVQQRTGHFFPAALLDSQLETVEPPTPDEPVPAITLDATLAPDALVRHIRRLLGV